MASPDSYPHSIPTPPFSPHALAPHMVSYKSTINLLDSLVAFYQQERMWVYRTRASLELAFHDAPASTNEPADTSPPTPASVPPAEEGESAVKAEPGTPPPMSPAQQTQQNRWLRRKRGFKLKLDGIPSRNRQGRPKSELPQSGVQILEMFEDMMESRMESCQRVNKLVRNANRADLHVR